MKLRKTVDSLVAANVIHASEMNGIKKRLVVLECPHESTSFHFQGPGWYCERCDHCGKDMGWVTTGEFLEKDLANKKETLKESEETVRVATQAVKAYIKAKEK